MNKTIKLKLSSSPFTNCFFPPPIPQSLIPEYQYLDFFKSQQIFSGASEFSFVFKSLLKRLKNTVLSKIVKIVFGEKNAIFDRKLRFLGFFLNFPVEAEKLIFKTKLIVFAPNQFAKFHTD